LRRARTDITHAQFYVQHDHAFADARHAFARFVLRHDATRVAFAAAMMPRHFDAPRRRLRAILSYMPLLMIRHMLCRNMRVDAYADV